MEQQNIDLINKTIDFVKNALKDQESGHAFDHIERVLKLSQHIASKEGNCNILIISLGALLHDIADHKFHNGDEEIGPKVASDFLRSQGAQEDVIDKVCQIIKKISFKGAKVKNEMDLLEGQIIQDADRLDAIGAIGIARTFNYGGFKGRKMYDPQEQPILHTNFEDYKKNQSCTINHFYEKLLFLKDNMNTKTGKEIAEDRHNFMLQFLERFKSEWEGQI